MQQIQRYFFKNIYGNSVIILGGHGIGARDYTFPPTAPPSRITVPVGLATKWHGNFHLPQLSGVEKLFWIIWQEVNIGRSHFLLKVNIEWRDSARQYLFLHSHLPLGRKALEEAVGEESNSSFKNSSLLLERHISNFSSQVASPVYPIFLR